MFLLIIIFIYLKPSWILGKEGVGMTQLWTGEETTDHHLQALVEGHQQMMAMHTSVLQALTGILDYWLINKFLDWNKSCMEVECTFNFLHLRWHTWTKRLKYDCFQQVCHPCLSVPKYISHLHIVPFRTIWDLEDKDTWNKWLNWFFIKKKEGLKLNYFHHPTYYMIISYLPCISTPWLKYNTRLFMNINHPIYNWKHAPIKISW